PFWEKQRTRSLNPTGLNLCYLEVKFECQLYLARVEDGARSAVERVGRTLAEVGCNGRTAKGCRIEWAEVRRAVHRVEKADVGGVEEVEGFRQEFQAALLTEDEFAANPKVDRPEIVADESVAWLDADAIVVAEDVAIGVEAGELGKAAGRLDGRDQPELIIPRQRIPGVWRSDGSIKNEAMANVVGGVGTLATEVLAVLWNQYKAGVGAVVDGLRPGVANAVREVVSQALIHVDEQAIVLRIPTRSCFEVDGDR